MSDLPDNVGIVMIEFGGKNRLDDDMIREAQHAPARAHARYPDAIIFLSLYGYDDDPRPIWEIPEAAEYVRCYALAAGLNDWHSSLFLALDETACGLLVACDALDKPHPFKVEIVADPT